METVMKVNTCINTPLMGKWLVHSTLLHSNGCDLNYYGFVLATVLTMNTEDYSLVLMSTELG